MQNQLKFKHIDCRVSLTDSNYQIKQGSRYLIRINNKCISSIISTVLCYPMDQMYNTNDERKVVRFRATVHNDKQLEKSGKDVAPISVGNEVEVYDLQSLSWLGTGKVRFLSL